MNPKVASTAGERSHLLTTLLSDAVVCALAAAPYPGGAQPSPDRKQQIEADWLTQEVKRVIGARSTDVTTQEDAVGACDGVKDGKWGFHTDLQDQPWWHVDLGEPHVLGRVIIYNRCDGGTPPRTAQIMLLVSIDGETWREVYRHDGTPFYGVTGGDPLTVPLDGVEARFVRTQLPHSGYFHLDEVEVYGAGDDSTNLALGKPADQSSVSQWSTRKLTASDFQEAPLPINDVIDRGRRLADDLAGAGVDVGAFQRSLDKIAEAAKALPPDGSRESRLALYLRARWLVRNLALSNPLLDFDQTIFAKRVPTSYSHMSDQYYGWWSRPGGGLYILEGFREDAPRLRCLTEGMPEGNFLRPDLSYDGRKILFAHCTYYPNLAGLADKVDKSAIPEDAFYHIFEMNVDGSGLRRLTQGKYDDFDARYLPSGDIVFLSTRRGQFVRCGKASAQETLGAALPDSYVRCGGDNSRPVAVYTLHVMDADGGSIRAISPFENFEWTPSVANDGRILYARWDYVDRSNMPYMSLWSVNPDGTNPQAVYGNFTHAPHCIFEARAIPGSQKLIFTGSAHHSITAGSLAVFDPGFGLDGSEPIQRLTPEVCFPEIEGWPESYYVNPYPLSERHYLVAWSNQALGRQGAVNPPNALGLYLYDAFGNLELLYRDPDISSMYPIPLQPRTKPQAIAATTDPEEVEQGRFLLLDVYKGLTGIERGTIKAIRVVGVPAKTQPQMNTPVLGVTRDDPGKYVIGTAPVEEDGSACFHAPAGVSVFLQALDADGLAVQTMRSLTCVQPGQTLSCVGCHEPRTTTPTNAHPLALRRPPSKLTVGPEGSWPLRFDRLVQPVLDTHCVSCHRADGPDAKAAAIDLTASAAWESLLSYGKPSLRDHVLARYGGGRSVAGEGAAQASALLALLRDGHEGLVLDSDSLNRLTTWMDTYGQRLGSFSDDQEQRLIRLRADVADILIQ